MLVKAKTFFCLFITLCLLSASVPLHNIFHDHHFIKVDTCGKHACRKHLKKYDEPCCHTSDAIQHLADLPKVEQYQLLTSVFTTLNTPYFAGNDFKLHFFVNNKAPPVQAA